MITQEMVNELNHKLSELGCLFKAEFIGNKLPIESSIEFTTINSIYIENANIQLTDEFYDMLKDFFKTKNVDDLILDKNKGIVRSIRKAKYNDNSLYYNLFVLTDDDMDNNTFIIPANKSLTILLNEDIQEFVHKEFNPISEENKCNVKDLPSLFVNNKTALIGNVTNIKVQENGIKIRFNPQMSFERNVFNDKKVLDALNIKYAFAKTELQDLHWTIKKNKLPLKEIVSQLNL